MCTLLSLYRVTYRLPSWGPYVERSRPDIATLWTQQLGTIVHCCAQPILCNLPTAKLRSLRRTKPTRYCDSLDTTTGNPLCIVVLSLYRVTYRLPSWDPFVERSRPDTATLWTPPLGTHCALLCSAYTM